MVWSIFRWKILSFRARWNTTWNGSSTAPREVGLDEKFRSWQQGKWGGTQLVVNWWFGARWFGFLGSPYERDCYFGASDSNPKPPQPKPPGLAISWETFSWKKNMWTQVVTNLSQIIQIFQWFCPHTLGRYPKLLQIPTKKFLHKLLVKFPGYLPGGCGWDLRFFQGHKKIISEYMSHEKKPLTFHYYWLFNRDPCNGSLYSPYDW